MAISSMKADRGKRVIIAYYNKTHNEGSDSLRSTYLFPSYFILLFKRCAGEAKEWGFPAHYELMYHMVRPSGQGPA